VVLIATLHSRLQEITTPALGAPPLLNQEGSYSARSSNSIQPAHCSVVSWQDKTKWPSTITRMLAKCHKVWYSVVIVQSLKLPTWKSRKILKII